MAITSDRIQRAQSALLLVFILVGHTALCSVAWVPVYIDRLGVSFATWGVILGVGAVGSMLSLLVASRIILRFGSRGVLRVALYVGLVFLVSLAFTTNPVIWAGLNAGFTLSMSFVGMSANTHAVVLQKLVPRTIVPRLHAGWSMGAVLAAMTGAISTALISLDVFLIATAIITLVLFEILRPRLLGPSEDGHLEDKAAHIKRRFYQAPAQLWVLSIGLFCAIYPEIAIVDWATVFATGRSRGRTGPALSTFWWIHDRDDCRAVVDDALGRFCSPPRLGVQGSRTRGDHPRNFCPATEL